MAKKEINFAVGERVAYAASFLKKISADRQTAQMRGTVVSSPDEFRGIPKVVKVKWDGENEVRGALAQNIARVGGVRFADASA
jgi:hypothetical protein